MSQPYYETIQQTLRAFGINQYKHAEATTDKWHDILTGTFTAAQSRMLTRISGAKNILAATSSCYEACTTAAARNACLDNIGELIEALLRVYIDAHLRAPIPPETPFPFPIPPASRKDTDHIHLYLLPTCREVFTLAGGSASHAGLLDDISKNTRLSFYGSQKNRRDEYILYSAMTPDQSYAHYVSGLKHGTLDWYSRQVAMTLLLDPSDQARYLAMIVNASTNDKTRMHNLFVGMQYDMIETGWTTRHGQQLEDLTEMLLFVNRADSSEAKAFNAKLLQNMSLQGAGPKTTASSAFLLKPPSADATTGRISHQDVFGGEIPMAVVSRDGVPFVDGQPIKDYIDACLQRMLAEWLRQQAASESHRPRQGPPRQRDNRPNDFDSSNRPNNQRRSQSQGRPQSQGRAPDRTRPRGAGEGDEPTKDARDF
jgi:hypothetical protein